MILFLLKRISLAKLKRKIDKSPGPDQLHPRI